MRYFRLIITALTLMSVTSCLFDNLELQTSDSNSKDEITIVGRITRFNDCEVQTRGAKEDDELKVTSIAMAIFLVNDAGTAIDGDCVYYDYNEGNQSMFTINRTLFTNYNNRRFVIYAFANIPGM